MSGFPIQLRALTENDILFVKMIHEKYFSDQFSFPDFSRGFLNCFVSEKNGEIISAGGVRLIPEVILVTDKSKSVKDRREALLKMLEVACFSAERYGELHAFVQDDIWKHHLLKSGFSASKGEALVFPFEVVNHGFDLR